MVRAIGSAALAAGLCAGAPAALAEPVDVAALMAAWPARFTLHGTKTEPTYIAHIRVIRDGDLFLVEGGAPAGMAPSREAVTVAADGSIRRTLCPAAMDCADPRPPTGFLATAAIIAAARDGRLPAALEPLAYGEFTVVCVPAEALGVHDPILDPCVEAHSGAVVAQRHRLSGAFDGPSLDTWSIAIETGATN